MGATGPVEAAVLGSWHAKPEYVLSHELMRKGQASRSPANTCHSFPVTTQLCAYAYEFITSGQVL